MSRSPPATSLVYLARVQELEAQMATLLNYIHLWMHKSIEDRLKNLMAQRVEKHIKAIHKRLVTFELHVLGRPTPTSDLSTIHADLTLL